MSKFSGFPRPEQNYSKLPHVFIECLPMINSMAELKVVIYLLRHTWGFSEYGKPKRITTDEFMNGRKRRDGSRIDGGTGLSKGSVITGLEDAVEHGFVLVEVNDSDKARIDKFYCLNMSGVQDLDTDVQDLDSRCSNVEQRTEKETKVRKQKKGDLVDAFLEYQHKPIGQQALIDFEQSFGFGTLPWNSNSVWEKFAKFVIRVSTGNPEWCKDYTAWRLDGGKYKAFSNRKIRENPAAFMDTGYPEYEASKMYRQEETGTRRHKL